MVSAVRVSSVGKQSKRTYAILPFLRKYWCCGNDPCVFLRRCAVCPSDGGGYGRVFEFVAAANFGELIPFLFASN
jgi:hypothetical protein